MVRPGGRSISTVGLRWVRAHEDGALSQAPGRLISADPHHPKPTKIAGVKARRLEWSGAYEGTPRWNIDVVVVRGKFVYVFENSSLEKITDTDRALFGQFISTVTSPSAPAATSAAPTRAGWSRGQVLPSLTYGWPTAAGGMARPTTPARMTMVTM